MHVCHIQPERYIHAQGLAELAETVYYGLQRLGVGATLGSDLRPSSIVIGAHLAELLPDDAIIYNTEQIHEGSPWVSENYLRLLRSHTVWDYSAQNVLRLAEQGITAKHVPVGYVPELRRITPAEVEDIDVLFCGSLNPRRQKILDDLKAAGLNVVHLFGVYGAERDSHIARAKIVLNMHFYESQIFEIVRCSYLWTNAACVVSEESVDMTYGPMLVRYEKLVSCCVAMCENPEWRDDRAREDLVRFKQQPEEDYLEAALKPETVLASSYQKLKERYLYACTAGFKLRTPKVRHPFSVVVPVNDEASFTQNLLASPGLAEVKPQIIKVTDARSAAEAFESGKAQAKTEWILYVHQDVWWPEGTGFELEAILEDTSLMVDIIGFAGIVNGEHAGFVIDRGWRFDHPITGIPTSIEEFALLLRRDVTLDPNLGWHTWGTDLCFRYSAKLVRVPLFHNSIHGHELPEAYHESGRKLLAKYPDRPIKTLNGELHG